MMPTWSITRWTWRMVASPGAGLGSVNPCATMAMRRAWAWVSRVMSRGTSALYWRSRTAVRRTRTGADFRAHILVLPAVVAPQLLMHKDMFHRGPLPSCTRRYPMIQNAQVTPILPVVDLSRATGFYRDRLGLTDLGAEAGN